MCESVQVNACVHVYVRLCIHAYMFACQSDYDDKEALTQLLDLKLQFRKYPAMHTNHMLYHCTTLQYNQNI